MATALLVAPLSMGASAEEVRTATSVFESFPLDTEGQDVRALSERLSWRQPAGLFGYSARSLYKDLWCYFDAAERRAPVHELATKALKMYGLGGAQHVMDWDVIRGPIVVMRLEPSSMFQPPPGWSYDPTLTAEEISETFDYFRRAAKSAQQIALARDARRFTQSLATAPPVDGGVYFGPSGTRPMAKIFNKDARHCANCGKAQVLATHRLRRCAQCNAAYYCDKHCQKQHWRNGHKA